MAWTSVCLCCRFYRGSNSVPIQAMLVVTYNAAIVSFRGTDWDGDLAVDLWSAAGETYRAALASGYQADLNKFYAAGTMRCANKLHAHMR